MAGVCAVLVNLLQGEDYPALLSVLYPLLGKVLAALEPTKNIKLQDDRGDTVLYEGEADQICKEVAQSRALMYADLKHRL